MIETWKNPQYRCFDLPTEPDSGIGKILVTGVSGYIGGRLVPELIARNYEVRIMVRAHSPQLRAQYPNCEIVVADALDYESLHAAMEGISVAYYLIHSLLLGPHDFPETEHRAANNFRRMAEHNGLKRIIYLGGLGEQHQQQLSNHLQSRIRVAEELQKGRTPVTVLRAAVIIGSGSASYEIIQDLVKKLPVILIPRWGHNRCQPIAVRDVIKTLVGVLELEQTSGKKYDIGGIDILTYQEMLGQLADLLNERLLFIPFFYSNIRFYAYAASLVTPVPAPITMALMEGLKNDVCCKNEEINEILPFDRIGYREAVVLAMTREEQDSIHTRWSDAYPPANELEIKLDELEKKPEYTTCYSMITSKSADSLFKMICQVGGKEGWFATNWMWRLRGAMDRILFGVGSSRGRKSHTKLTVNDVVDFWRIEELVPGRRLLLRAEMKLPGKAWLEFCVKEVESKRVLSVTPYYYTQTIWGRLYWYIFLPFHEIIFNDIIKQIERRSASQ